MNIADLVGRRARQAPASPALLRGDWRMSNAQADSAVARIAAILAAEGISASDLVGVSIRGSPVLLLLSILAIARLGAVLVPILPSTPPAKRKAIAEHFGLKAMVGGAGDRGAGDARRIRADIAWLGGPATSGVPPGHPGGEQPWCITLTSGTTGTPKGVLRTHADFLSVAELQRPSAHLKADSRFLVCMDLHNSPALKRALRHLAFGGPLAFLHADFPGSELPLERHRVSHAFVSPAMVEDWLRARPRDAQPYPALEQLDVGAGVVSPALEAEIVARITPNLCLSYGTTETGVAALSDPQTRARHPGATGRIVPWLEAQVVDEDGRPLPAGRSGLLRFRGPGVVRGYFGISADESTGARGFRDGWFYPGDAARLEPGGVLYFEGRVDDIINLGGPKLNAIEVEALLKRHPGVREAAVLAIAADGTTHAFAAVAVDGAFDSADLARHYREQGGRYGDMLRFVEVSRLPRGGTGKVLKHELKRQIMLALERAATEP